MQTLREMVAFYECVVGLRVYPTVGGKWHKKYQSPSEYWVDDPAINDLVAPLGEYNKGLCVRLLNPEHESWLKPTGLPLMRGKVYLVAFFRSTALTTERVWADGKGLSLPFAGNHMRWVTPFGCSILNLPSLTPEQAERFERAEIESVTMKPIVKSITKPNTNLNESKQKSTEV